MSYRGCSMRLLRAGAMSTQPTLLRHASRLGSLVSLASLSACSPVVLNPAGDIAKQEASLVVTATLLMLIIIIPVMALTVYFAWKYREKAGARYEPEWHHSTQLELVIWAAPLMIIIALGSLTWVTTHTLDPFRPVGRIAEGKPLAADAKPLEVQVVALDWKWLFIYPEQKIASVNELALPVDRPVHFSISASSVMNSFYVPALAGQIYAMPAMKSELNAVLNKTGTFDGFSANYSGSGFSHMRFKTLGMTAADFDQWAADIAKGADKSSAGALDTVAYLQLEQPSEKEPVRHFTAVADGLFDKVVNLCVRPGKMCLKDMMALDARGGTGKAGIYNVAALTYDKNGRETTIPVIPGRAAQQADARTKAFVRAICVPDGVKTPVPAPISAAPAKLSLAAPARTPLS